ncbi:hypothetical protein HH299_19330, partial [Xanthomonas sp. Kuri4-2]
LGPGRWQATVYADGDSPTDVRIDTRTLEAGARTLRLALVANGGAALRLTPLR